MHKLKNHNNILTQKKQYQFLLILITLLLIFFIIIYIYHLLTILHDYKEIIEKLSANLVESTRIIGELRDENNLLKEYSLNKELDNNNLIEENKSLCDQRAILGIGLSIIGFLGLLLC
jgi:hypothetical protein